MAIIKTTDGEKIEVNNTLATEMRICEVNHIYLRPNQVYVFTVSEDCAACKEYAGVYADELTGNVGR